MADSLKRTKKIVITALFSAIIIVLQFMSYYFAALTKFNLSFVLVPIVLGGILLGPKFGAVFGAVFGVVTILCSMLGLDTGGAVLFQVSPYLTILMCLLKAVLAGFLSALAYKLLDRNNKISGTVKTIIAAVICPIVNTGIFVSCMLMFFPTVLTDWAKGKDIFIYIMLSLLGVNFLIELTINLVLCPVIKNSVKAFNKF